jgi:hypothetical protein
MRKRARGRVKTAESRSAAQGSLDAPKRLRTIGNQSGAPVEPRTPVHIAPETIGQSRVFIPAFAGARDSLVFTTDAKECGH